MADKKNQILSTYVGDVQAVVRHGLQAIGRQVQQLRGVSHQDAKKAVVAFEGLLRNQDMALEDCLKRLGGSATQPVKTAVAAVAGVAAGLIDAVRPSETVKCIRDDYTFFSQLGIAWLMLHTTASSLGDQATAELAERGYGDTTRAIMHIDRIMPQLVVEELAEDPMLQVASSQEATRAMVGKSWDRTAPAGI